MILIIKVSVSVLVSNRKITMVYNPNGLVATNV